MKIKIFLYDLFLYFLFSHSLSLFFFILVKYNMGAYLSKPVTEKVSSDESNENLVCGASTMQGWRVDQEVIFFFIEIYCMEHILNLFFLLLLNF